MATDFTKMPPEILVDLINLTNAISLRTPDITYSSVSKLAAGNRNSGVTIFATPGSIYSGSRDLTYNRVSFQQVVGTRSVAFDRGSATFVSHLLPQINLAYAINLQPEDYYNDPLPTPTGSDYASNATFKLRARPGSYVWIGEIELTLRGNQIPLRSLWGVNFISGFSLPEQDLEDTLQVNLLSGFNLPEKDLEDALQANLLSGFNYAPGNVTPVHFLA